MHSRLNSIESGNFFFQPAQLHLEPTDLLVQLRHQGVLLLDLAAAIVGEQLRRPVQQSPLPLADLRRMHAELPTPVGSSCGLPAPPPTPPSPSHPPRSVVVSLPCNPPKSGPILPRFRPKVVVQFLGSTIAFLNGLPPTKSRKNAWQREVLLKLTEWATVPPSPHPRVVSAMPVGSSQGNGSRNGNEQ